MDELAEQLEKLKTAKLEKEIRNLKGKLYGNRNPSNSKLKFDPKKVKCYACGKIGHTSKYCRERNDRRINIYEYDEEYDKEGYYYKEESEEDEYQIYYQESELYPAERTTRSKARTDPTQG
jgi:hypothetical protein